MNDPIFLQILLQMMLILLNAIFACGEIAVISMNDNKLAQLASQGDTRAIRLARLTSQPARFLATIQVAITLSGFLGSAFAADNFSDKLVAWLVGLGVNWPVATLDTLSVMVITLVLSYFTLVFGELVPKRIAMQKAEALALGMSGLIAFIAKLFAPIVWGLTVSTNGILRLCGIDPHAADDQMSEEEIRMMVDVGNQNGVIDFAKKEFIQNVFEFDDLMVGAFATHRTDIVLLWLNETDQDWEKTIQESRHSLYPICNETIEQVVGVLNVKDYFRLKDKSRENIMNTVVQPAYFIPRTIYADVLFKQMKKSHNHLAVVLDEYGGMMGIVTMNDLLEQLVGDLEDQLPDKNTPLALEQIAENTWKIQGSISLDEVAEALATPLPVDDYDTFSGFVFGSYGLIPDDGSTFELKAWNLQIQIIRIKDHRIEEALIILSA